MEVSMGVFIRRGHCHVSRVIDLTTHMASLETAPETHEKFEKKQPGCIKVVLSLCGRRQSPQRAGGQTAPDSRFGQAEA